MSPSSSECNLYFFIALFRFKEGDDDTEEPVSEEQVSDEGSEDEEEDDE